MAQYRQAGTPTTVAMWICRGQVGKVLEGDEDELRGDDDARDAPGEVGPCCQEAEQGLELVRGQDGAEAAESAAGAAMSAKVIRLKLKRDPPPPLRFSPHLSEWVHVGPTFIQNKKSQCLPLAPLNSGLLNQGLVVLPR